MPIRYEVFKFLVMVRSTYLERETMWQSQQALRVGHIPFGEVVRFVREMAVGPYSEVTYEGTSFNLD